jgi:hypothetical protein
MSETTETTPAPEPEPTPAPGTGPSGAPESTPPDTEEPEQKPQREADEARAKEDRRIAQLRARLGAAEREQARQAAELAFYREQAQRVPQAEETPEQRYARERAQIRTEVEAQIRTERFHEQGASAYGDWKQKCDDLVKMGADAGFAQLLVEMPDGVKVAAALANDPDQVEHIANLRSERARAVALGKYAATLDADDGGTRAPPRAAPQVTRAPAPIRPVTGRAAPTFNEYTADGQTLVDRYMKQAMDKRLGR